MPNKVRRIFLHRILFPVLLSAAFSNSYSQQLLFSKPVKYYASLIQSLNTPDSLFIYETNSSWGSGIAYFISFKDATITASGYYLNNNFIYRQLSPRHLMPADSLNNIIRIVYNTSQNNYLLSEINKLKIFQLPEGESVCADARNSIMDGASYQFSKITKDKVLYRRYYEIYEYSKLCPGLEGYKRFIALDKLLNKYFDQSQIILKDLINEFKKKALKNSN